MEDIRHVPVMPDRVLNLLAPALEFARTEGRVPLVVDATLGMGGHTFEILRTFPDARVVGIDRDTDALYLATQRLTEFTDRLDTYHGTYDEIPEALEASGVDRADGYLFDLGVSSFQLDEKARGFAYSYDAPLDMRMDATTGPTAAEILNSYSAQNLERIIRIYGEEKFARRIAEKVVATRHHTRYETTQQLVDTIIESIPVAVARTGGHPAKRTFQALRIEVNEELRILERAIPTALEYLHLGGRLIAMSYQSLEDKIVKAALKKAATSLTPPDFPVELEEHAPEITILTRGTEKPTDQEISHNSRAASARVRAAEKIRPTRHPQSSITSPHPRSTG